MMIIRDCQGFDELQACVDLQVETWGVDVSDTVPRKSFVVAQKIGGQVIGAFDDEIAGASPMGGPESLVAFAFSLPAVKAGAPGDRSSSMGRNTGEGEPRAYLHSHMLAVRETYRNQGLGTLLKLEQRRKALARGIRHMEWTFDPLEIKNAFLNIHKLGAIARTYEVDFYGVSSSRLQGGLPTDRLVAEWDLDSPRVEAVLGGDFLAAPTVVERIAVPASIYEWKAREADREKALGLQLENRRKFQEAFARGLAVIGFNRDEEGDGVFELGPVSQLILD